MKRGFTLLELIVVIIILGVLATLGFTNYARMIEKSRGAEARTVLGNLRTQAAAFRMENGTLAPGGVAITMQQVGIGAAADQITITCAGQTRSYFSYQITAVADPEITFTASRCLGATGRQPGATAAGNLTLRSNLVTGVDTWGGNGGY